MNGWEPGSGVRFIAALPPRRNRLVRVVEAFELGTRARSVDVLRDDPDLRPYALEGLGFASGLRGTPSLFPCEPSELSQAERALHSIGVGWAVDRLGRDGPFAELVEDGRGFHRTFFHAYLLHHPRRLVGSRAFDRGVGRALWFVRELDAIPSTIDRFDPLRRARLWEGVGMAAAFTGDVDDSTLTGLADAGGEHFAIGVAIAGTLRTDLGWIPPHTERALRIVGSTKLGTN